MGVLAEYGGWMINWVKLNEGGGLIVGVLAK